DGVQLEALHGLWIAGFSQLSEHHRAGAAIAFVAALLGAGAARVLAQPVQHDARGGQAFICSDTALVVETDGLWGGHGAHGGAWSRIAEPVCKPVYKRSVPRGARHNRPAIGAMVQRVYFWVNPYLSSPQKRKQWSRLAGLPGPRP